MTWTRLDDGWCDRPVLEQLTYETRWHYLALINWCSRTNRYDGVVRTSDARRCSDVPDPGAALAALADVGLLQVVPEGVKVVLIDEHVPPPHLRDDRRRQYQREKQQRSRAHRAGDHSLCLPTSPCHSFTSDVTSDTGTGRDGTGREDGTTPATGWDSVEWPTVAEPGTGLRAVP